MNDRAEAAAESEGPTRSTVSLTAATFTGRAQTGRSTGGGSF
jgi:hypothetical protein